ncbi:MAG: DUF4384 domain-containing protein [Bryobacteraceae bacterium]
MRPASSALFTLAVFIAVPAWAQSNPAPDRMKLAVERSENGQWRAVDPNLIFLSGDRVRFRFSANFDGYLYVMNRSTSGKYEILFPRQDTGVQNRVQSGHDYIVPATQGWFRVTGPPGHDVLYWVVSPLSLAGGGPSYRPLPPPPPPGAAPPDMHPRCDDTIFKARGDCVDSSAGPKQVSEAGQLPSNLRGLPTAGSRGLLFLQNENQLVVASPGPLFGPVVYEFQLSHR